MAKGVTSWQITLPPGTYRVNAVLPKDSHSTCEVQGVATGGDKGRFVYDAEVVVTDGKLSISGDFPTCHSIQDVRIVRVGAPSVAATCGHVGKGE